MSCFDCAGRGKTTHAVAACVDCGAALCGEHAHVAARWLTRTMALHRSVAVQPPARTIYCGICYAAHDARGDIAAEPPPLLRS